MELNITQKKPSECTNITEVRNEIDNIDKVVIALLKERFQYVKEVVKYKEKTAASIEASDRREAVIVQRRQWAEENGLNPDVIEEIYKRLIQYFIDEEKKIINL
ncbi:MAG: chorismate mutase [Bacteroidales bacterium]|nr:chorismate mutase [Bacteroidales bacterium]